MELAEDRALASEMYSGWSQKTQAGQIEAITALAEQFKGGQAKAAARTWVHKHAQQLVRALDEVAYKEEVRAQTAKRLEARQKAREWHHARPETATVARGVPRYTRAMMEVDAGHAAKTLIASQLAGSRGRDAQNRLHRHNLATQASYWSQSQASHARCGRHPSQPAAEDPEPIWWSRLSFSTRLRWIERNSVSSERGQATPCSGPNPLTAGLWEETRSSPGRGDPCRGSH